MSVPGLPESIGPYLITGIVGKGGMGAVYKGQHQDGGDEVAIKLIKATGQGHAEDRFVAEARVLQEIEHPNVIRCLDVGDCPLGLYMVLELIAGGDVGALIKASGGQLDELRALRIAQDVARGLEALEESSLVHRDIKPENIFLTPAGSAKLADFGVVYLQEASQHYTKLGMPVGTMAYMAPEQAQAQGAVDSRADIYAVGATLFSMLCGRPPFLGENPMMTMLMVVNEPFPDCLALRPDCSPATAQLIAKATAKQADARYQHAAELHEALTGLIDHLQQGDEEDVPRPASSARDADRRGDSGAAPTTPRAEEALATSSGHAMLDRLDPGGLQRVMQRVRIHESRLSAWVNLAPEVSFPSVLLRAVLVRRDITYGLREGAIIDASRRSVLPRRVVLAQGDPPSPGCPGRDVFAQEIPPLHESALVRCNADGTEAWLLTVPGTLPSREAVQAALIKAGIRFGIDRDTLALAWEGPATADGRRLVARAKAMKPARPAGFALLRLALTAADEDNLQPVESGDIIARWHEAEAGQPGMDVFGQVIAVPAVSDASPDQQAGEGVDVSRDREGRMVLRATRDGHVQQRVNGVVRVVRVHQVDGDLSIHDPGVHSDDVVLITGSVRSGARISCANDVVIRGDLEDACVEAGGSIEVHGDVKPGVEALVGVDAVAVQGRLQRRAVAGNLRVEGSVEHCELLATGSITLARVTGGSITAGGSVYVDFAGDEMGTTTELWAGRNLPYDDQERMARLAERRLAAERWRLVEECRQLQDELGKQEKRGLRLHNALRPEVLQRHHKLLARLEERFAEAAAARETSRHRLAKQRELLRELGGVARNHQAEVEVRVRAHFGVVARVADADPLRIDRNRHRLHLTLEQARNG